MQQARAKFSFKDQNCPTSKIDSQSKRTKLIYAFNKTKNKVLSSVSVVKFIIQALLATNFLSMAKACTDTDWAVQSSTWQNFVVGTDGTYTPVRLSSPTGCKTATIYYEDLIISGASASDFPDFITEDSSTHELAVSPQDVSALDVSGLTFTLRQSDPDGVIADQSETITFFMKIDEDYCNQSEFSTLNDLIFSIPSEASEVFSLQKSLQETDQASYCGSINHEYQTSYTDPETSETVIIDSSTNDGFPSFMSLAPVSATEDLLTIDAVYISQVATYNISVIRILIYSGRVVDENLNPMTTTREVTQTFSIDVQSDCSSLAYTEITTESYLVLVEEEITIDYSCEYVYDYGSGQQTTDQEGTEWSATCGAPSTTIFSTNEDTTFMTIDAGANQIQISPAYLYHIGDYDLVVTKQSSIGSTSETQTLTVRVACPDLEWEAQEITESDFYLDEQATFTPPSVVSTPNGCKTATLVYEEFTSDGTALEEMPSFVTEDETNNELTILAAASSDILGAPYTFKIRQTDAEGVIADSLTDYFVLNAKITEEFCDLADFSSSASNMSSQIPGTSVNTIPRGMSETMQSELCGKVVNDYTTVFTDPITSNQETFTSSSNSGFPEFIVLNSLSEVNTLKRNWETTQSNCEDDSSNLISILSQEQNDALLRLTNEEDIWIGLNKLEDYVHSEVEEGADVPWSWVNGSALSYTNWGADEPDESKDCAYMDSSDGMWYTDTCSGTKRYACSVEQSFTDSLVINSQNMSGIGTYEVSYTQTLVYDDRVVRYGTESRTNSAQFEIEVTMRCQTLSYTNIPSVTQEVNAGETITISSLETLLYNYGSGKQNTDLEGTDWSEQCGTAIITFTDIDEGFMTFDSDTQILTIAPTLQEHIGVFEITINQSSNDGKADSEDTIEIETFCQDTGWEYQDEATIIDNLDGTFNFSTIFDSTPLNCASFEFIVEDIFSDGVLAEDMSAYTDENFIMGNLQLTAAYENLIDSSPYTFTITLVDSDGNSIATDQETILVYTSLSEDFCDLATMSQLTDLTFSVPSTTITPQNFAYSLSLAEQNSLCGSISTTYSTSFTNPNTSATETVESSTNSGFPDFMLLNHEFQVFTEALTRNAAQTNCAGLGGSLASIHSQEENDFVVSLASGLSSIWIGYNDLDTAGSFDWSDGSTLDFENWNSDEPASANCATLNQDYGWNAISCTSTSIPGYVCKVPIGDVDDSLAVSLLNLSFAGTYTVTATLTLTYDNRVASSEPTRVETQEISITVSVDCSFLTLGPVSPTEYTVEVGTPYTIAPVSSYMFDYGNGELSTDLEGTEWSSSCGVPEIYFTGQNEAFMTVSGFELVVSATHRDHVATHEITVQQLNTHIVQPEPDEEGTVATDEEGTVSTDEEGTIATEEESTVLTVEDSAYTVVQLTVICTDTEWKEQTAATTLTLELNQYKDFRPVYQSSPLGCKYSSITYSGMQTGYMWTYWNYLRIRANEEADLGTHTITYTRSDSTGVIADDTYSIEITTYLSEAYCDAAAFIEHDSITAVFPYEQGTLYSITNKMLDICGTLTYSYSTQFTDPVTSTSDSIESSNNNGFPSFISMELKNLLNPPNDQRTFSSSWNENSYWEKSMIYSTSGWHVGKEYYGDEDDYTVLNEGSWMTIDAGEQLQIYGLVLQGRYVTSGNEKQIIETIQVAQSDDGADWQYIQDGYTFDTGIVAYESEYTYIMVFTSPITSQHIKIFPITYPYNVCLRAGLLVDESTADSTFISEVYTILPTLISQATTYTTSIEKTLVYSDAVTRTTSGDKVQTNQFDIVIEVDCSVLTYSAFGQALIADFQETLVLTPTVYFSYDYGSGLQTTDEEGTEWQTACGTPTVVFSGEDSTFMTIDQNTQEISIYPTEVSQLGTYDITVTKSSTYGQEDEVETITITVNCQDTEWESQAVTEMTVDVDDTLVFEPIITSYPLRCKSATIVYEEFTTAGASASGFPAFITEDETTQALTISPTLTQEIIDSPYTFKIRHTDALGAIDETLTDAIVVNAQITEDQCNLASFVAQIDISSLIPNGTSQVGTIQELNPSEDARNYSTVNNDDAIGTGCARSTLDSVDAWCAASGDSDPWMTIDAGEEINLAGIIVQARGNSCCPGQLINTLTVLYSTDNSEWFDVQSGEVFTTGISSTEPDEKKHIVFNNSFSARYVKILPKSAPGWTSMRAGLIQSSDYQEFHSLGKQLSLEMQSLLCGTVTNSYSTTYTDPSTGNEETIASSTNSGFPSFMAISEIDSAYDFLALAPVYLSQATSYLVTVTRTLAYHDRVFRSTSGNRVETEQFTIDVQIDCSALAYTVLSTSISVDVGSTITITPDSFMYDFGSGLQETDLEAVSWSTQCGTATIVYAGEDSNFMTIDSATQEITISPTLADHIGDLTLTITQASDHGQAAVDTEIAISVTCQDTEWEPQAVTEISLNLNEVTTLTPTLISTPIGCKTASIVYESFTSGGASASEFESFISEDAATGVLTISPTDSASVLNTPYTFAIKQTDSEGFISENVTEIITINVLITEEQCDESAFEVQSDVTAVFPLLTEQSYVISKQLADSIQQDLCGEVTYSYQTSDPVTLDYDTYIVSTGTATWQTAQSNCEGLGGNLATILNERVNEYTVDQAGGQRIWIGLNDIQDEGNWTWIEDGSSMSYSDWASGEPNDYGSGEDCALLYSNSIWNDVPCSRQQYYMCVISTNNDSSNFMRIEIQESSQDTLVVNPSYLSQLGTYQITVTQTLEYNARVVRSTSGNRVETLQFNIEVQVDCSALAYTTLTASVDVDVGATYSIQPSPFMFDFGSGLQETDLEDVSWSTHCGKATVAYTDEDSRFMTVDSSSKEITISPTLAEHIGDFTLTVTQSTDHGQAAVDTPIAISVTCQDTEWETQPLTEISLNLNDVETFTPVMVSSPEGCKTAQIVFEAFTSAGASTSEFESFISEDATSRVLTISPIDSASVLNTPYTFAMRQTDSEGFISENVTQTITINVLITEEQCDESAFEVQSDLTAVFPLLTEQSYVIPRQLTDQIQQDLCGQVTYSYQTSDSITLDYVTYEVSTSATTWETAQSNCEGLGGNLATANSQRLIDLIYELSGGERVWIGLNDIQVEDNFIWIDGSSQKDFSNWKSSQPDNWSTGEDCAEIHNSQWNDHGCTQTKNYVCQISTGNFASDFITIDQQEVTQDTFMINPSFLSQLGTYQITVTQTLAFDARVVRSTSGDRVETAQFNIDVQLDCSALTYTTLSSPIDVDVGQIHSIQPSPFMFDFGSGLQETDQENVSWSTQCGKATVAYTDDDTRFMTVDYSSQEITISPTLAEHIGDFVLTVTQSTDHGQATVDTSITIIVTCQDTEWEPQAITEISLNLHEVTTLTPTLVSSPEGCKTAQIVFESFTSGGASASGFESFISEDATSRVLTIQPTDSASVLNSPYTFAIRQTDSESFISENVTETITINILITEEQCDQSAFDSLSDITAVFPILTEQSGMIVKQLADSIQQDLCGEVIYSYQTDYTDSNTSSAMTVSSSTNNGFASFMTVDLSEATFDTVVISPTFLSQVTVYQITVTQTLAFDVRVIRSTSGNRVETAQFNIDVQVDCSALTYTVLTENQEVEIESTLVIQPSPFLYDFGSGLSGTDQEGVLWSTLCGTAAITFTDHDTTFMTVDSGAQELVLAPMLMEQIDFHDVNVNQSSTHGQAAQDMTITIRVVCPDILWQAQPVTQMDVYIGETSTFMPNKISTPILCNEARIVYTELPGDWTVGDEETGELSITPDVSETTFDFTVYYTQENTFDTPVFTEVDDVELDLTIKISQATCDSIALQEIPDFSISYLKSGVNIVPKQWSMEPYISICGYVTHAYEVTYFDATVYALQLELTDGLPSAISVQQSLYDEDYLYVTSENMNEIGIYEVTVTQTRHYSDRVVDVSPEPSIITATFSITIEPSCSQLQYYPIFDGFKVYTHEETIFEPELALAYEYESTVGLQTRDLRSRGFELMCNAGLVFQIDGTEKEFTTRNSVLIEAEDICFGSITQTFTLTELGQKCDAPLIQIDDQSVCEDAAADLTYIFSGTVEDLSKPPGCFLGADENAYFNQNTGYQPLDSEIKAICYAQSECQTAMSSGVASNFILSLYPTLPHQLGWRSFNAIQVSQDLTTIYEQQINFEVLMNVWTELSFGEEFEEEILYFKIDTSEEIVLPYNITTQDTPLDQQFFFEFVSFGDVITQWIDVNQEDQTMSIFPVDLDVVGFHTIQITFRAVYLEEPEVLDYLVSPTLNRDTILQTLEFQLEIIAPDIEYGGPEFFDEPDDQIKVLGRYWQFELPEINDPAGAPVDIAWTIQPNLGFVMGLYDDETKTQLQGLKIEPEAILEQTGEYLIGITLTAVGEERNNIYTVSLVVELEEDSESEKDSQNQAEEQEVEEEDEVLETGNGFVFDANNYTSANRVRNGQGEEVELEPISAKILNINSEGQVTIFFSQDMNFDFLKVLKPTYQRRLSTISSIAQHVFEVNVIPGLEQNPEDTEFEWKLEIMSNTTLEIQLNFTNTYAISSTREVDQLQILFKNPEIFSNKEGSVALKTNSIIRSLPPQIPQDSTTTAVIQSTGKSIKSASMFAGAAGFIFGASLSLIFGTLGMIQIYTHFPLFDIIFPGTTFAVLSVFIDIATLDLITSEKTFSDVLHYNPTQGMEAYNTRFELLGYETESVIYNLGDLSLIQFWIFVKLLKLAFYKIFSVTDCCWDNNVSSIGRKVADKRKASMLKNYEEEKTSLFWNWPSAFLLGAFIELAFAGILKVQGGSLSSATFTDFFDSSCGIFFLIAVFVFPLWHFIFFTVKSEELIYNNKFYKKYKAFFGGYNIKKLLTLQYNGIFMFRRLIFVLNCMYLEGRFRSFQTIYVMIDSLLFTSYIIAYMPNREKAVNKIEIYTEVSILAFVYSFVCFSEFVPDPEVRYKISYVSTSIFILNVFVCLSAVARDQYLVCKQFWYQSKGIQLFGQGLKRFWTERSCCNAERAKKQQKEILYKAYSNIHLELSNLPNSRQKKKIVKLIKVKKVKKKKSTAEGSVQSIQFFSGTQDKIHVKADYAYARQLQAHLNSLSSNDEENFEEKKKQAKEQAKNQRIQQKMKAQQKLQSQQSPELLSNSDKHSSRNGDSKDLSELQKSVNKTTEESFNEIRPKYNSSKPTALPSFNNTAMHSVNQTSLNSDRTDQEIENQQEEIQFDTKDPQQVENRIGSLSKTLQSRIDNFKFPIPRVQDQQKQTFNVPDAIFQQNELFQQEDDLNTRKSKTDILVQKRRRPKKVIQPRLDLTLKPQYTASDVSVINPQNQNLTLDELRKRRIERRKPIKKPMPNNDTQKHYEQPSSTIHFTESSVVSQEEKPPVKLKGEFQVTQDIVNQVESVGPDEKQYIKNLTVMHFVASLDDLKNPELTFTKNEIRAVIDKIKLDKGEIFVQKLDYIE